MFKQLVERVYHLIMHITNIFVLIIAIMMTLHGLDTAKMDMILKKYNTRLCQVVKIFVQQFALPKKMILNKANCK